MVVLASASPRRRELMALLDVPFRVAPSDAEETLASDITPAEAVEYLSDVKATALSFPDDIIIGADTVVALGDTILGKPVDENDAKRMLGLLSGKSHSVFTGVTVLKNDKKATFSVETKVIFYTLTQDEIDAYVATGEPMDKAGAYGIQGRGSLLVEKIEGDYFNVVGLPVSALNKCLKEFL